MGDDGIRLVESGEVERAVGVVVLAFASDPIARWLYPDSRAYLEHFPEFVHRFGGRAFEHGTALVDEDFGGAALWLPVGVEVDGEAMGQWLQDTVDEARLAEMATFFGQMASHHTPDPHWYLPLIGVDPAGQGKGIGSRLMRRALASCDALGVAAYLESSNPSNVPFYERHGFEVVAEIQVGASPTAHPMLRAPR